MLRWPKQRCWFQLHFSSTSLKVHLKPKTSCWKTKIRLFKQVTSLSFLLGSKYFYNLRSRHGAVTPSHSAVLCSNFKKMFKCLLSNAEKHLWASIWSLDQRVTEPCGSWSSRETFPLLWPVLSSPMWTFKFYPECTLWSFLRWIKSIKRRCSFLLACRGSGLTPPRSRRTCSCYISWVYCTNKSISWFSASTETWCWR